MKSLPCLRGASCDHSRSMRARTQVRIRETLGKRIRHLAHNPGSPVEPLVSLYSRWVPTWMRMVASTAPPRMMLIPIGASTLARNDPGLLVRNDPLI